MIIQSTSGFLIYSWKPLYCSMFFSLSHPSIGNFLNSLKNGKFINYDFIILGQNSGSFSGPMIGGSLSGAFLALFAVTVGFAIFKKRKVIFISCNKEGISFILKSQTNIITMFLINFSKKITTLIVFQNMSEHNAKIKVIKIKMLGKKRFKTMFWTSKKY